MASDRWWKESDVTLTPTSMITVENEDVLASARVDLQRALDRGRYPSRRAWAEAVLASGEPVDLYYQPDGQLSLLDGNHRFLAATIVGQPLPSIIHGLEGQKR